MDQVGGRKNQNLLDEAHNLLECSQGVVKKILIVIAG